MYHIQSIRPFVASFSDTDTAKALPVTPLRNETTGRSVVSNRSSSLSSKVPPPVTKQTSSYWYKGIFGNVKVQTKSRYIGVHATDEDPVVEKRIWTIKPSFVSYVLEMHYAQSFGHVSKSLNMYPILKDNHHVFRLCSRGDIKGLQVALSSGEVSPFVLDEIGWTLLHVSAPVRQLLICYGGLTVQSTLHSISNPSCVLGCFSLE